MYNNIFPTKLENAIKSLVLEYLQEIRVRVDKPVTVCYKSQTYFLGENGLVNSKLDALKFSKQDLENIVHRASNFSIYTINDELKQGYITLSNGIRIGVVGQVVTENDAVITVKNFSSLTIRIPHEIKGIAENIIDFLLDAGDFLNTLIVSPPSAGKTTLLRDLIRLLASLKYAKNVLVADERNEISASINGKSSMDLGEFSDVIITSTKKFAFSNGIRSMAPDIIATDEIGTKSDFECLEQASTCGVKILATIHAKTIDELKNKSNFKPFVNQKIFQRYVVLSTANGKGTIEKIYDENFNEIGVV